MYSIMLPEGRRPWVCSGCMDLRVHDADCQTGCKAGVVVPAYGLDAYGHPFQLGNDSLPAQQMKNILESHENVCSQEMDALWKLYSSTLVCMYVCVSMLLSWLGLSMHTHITAWPGCVHPQSPISQGGSNTVRKKKKKNRECTLSGARGYELLKQQLLPLKDHGQLPPTQFPDHAR